MKTKTLIALLAFLTNVAFAQTLYVPGGTTGIGNNTNNTSVGIGTGTNAPQFKLHVMGNFGVQGDGSSQYPDLNLKNGAQRWHISGPRLGDASNNRLGIFWNDGTSFYDYLTIATTGNIGIGTNNPTAKLEVHNNVDNNILFVRQDKNNGGSGDAIYFRDDRGYAGTNSGTTFKVESWRGAGQQGGTLANFQTIDNGFNKSRLFINNDNGNVGMGTTTPLNTLHVYGAEPSGELNLLIQNSGGARTYLTSFAGKSSIQTDKNFSIMTNNGGGAWTDKLVVTNSGNVGIGTSLTNNPNGYKLAVNGTIGAKEIQVENTSSTWADYVFEPTYKLMDLTQVDAFVKANKHLPEIPSAEEVKEKGHKLGEMDVLLLKKVEELTLYMIELKQENQIQKEQNELLKKEIEILKARVEKL